MTDNLRTAILPRHSSHLSVQCPSLAHAVAFNTSCLVPREICPYCTTVDKRAKCVCEPFRPLQYLNDSKAILPQRVGATVLKQQNGHVFSDTQLSDLQLQLSFDKLTLKTKMDFSQCSLEPVSLVGCGSCGSGATWSYFCTTDFGETLGHVFCPSSNFSVVCTSSKVLRQVILTLPSGRISEKCRLMCPHSVSEVPLQGSLHLAPNVDLMLATFVPTNATQTHGTLLDWFHVFCDHLLLPTVRLWAALVFVACITLSIAGTAVICVALRRPQLAIVALVLVSVTAASETPNAEKSPSHEDDSNFVFGLDPSEILDDSTEEPFDGSLPQNPSTHQKDPPKLVGSTRPVPSRFKAPKVFYRTDYNGPKTPTFPLYPPTPKVFFANSTSHRADTDNTLFVGPPIHVPAPLMLPSPQRMPGAPPSLLSLSVPAPIRPLMQRRSVPCPYPCYVPTHVHPTRTPKDTPAPSGSAVPLLSINVPRPSFYSVPRRPPFKRYTS